VTAARTPDVDSGNAVELIDLRRSFGSAVALDGLTMDIARGELVALLGPSGCGKTTALRALAGLEDLDGGRVVVHGRDVTHLPANKRDMGMVFQAYSLFPHLSALENVGYGLRLATRRVPAARRRARARELLELVGLAEQANRFPHQLSGGQQQRVALARALAINPAVLLLDEPLSALDAKVRAQLRDEIRRIQTEVGATTLFVTHDQEEALGIADRVGVMRAGRLEQLAAPVGLYGRPASAFVAEFVGQTNPVPGTVADGHVMGWAVACRWCPAPSPPVPRWPPSGRSGCGCGPTRRPRGASRRCRSSARTAVSRSPGRTRSGSPRASRGSRLPCCRSARPST